VNLRDIWQAAYTAGRVLPKPVATCQYWHRSLDPKKVRWPSHAWRLLPSATSPATRACPYPSTPNLA